MSGGSGGFPYFVAYVFPFVSSVRKVGQYFVGTFLESRISKYNSFSQLQLKVKFGKVFFKRMSVMSNHVSPFRKPVVSSALKFLTL